MVMTVKQIEEARKLWREGLSAGKIAKKIGATRSSVCGYAYRHRGDFPARVTEPVIRHEIPTVADLDVKKPQPAPKRTKSTSPRLADSGLFALESKPPQSIPRREELPKPEVLVESVDILGLTNHTCRFPLSEFSEKCGPDTLYCGAEPLPGKSWCRKHAAVVFDKVPK